jgi:molecular chaperone GrpE
VPKKKNSHTEQNPLPGEQGAPEEIPAESGEETEAKETVEAPPSLEQELAASRAETQKNWDLYLRSRADLENFRKRTQREKEDLARFANEKILREVLPVVDNLERALDHARKEDQGVEGLLQGVEMTLDQLQKALEKFGVTPVDALGAPFDPAFHEAVGQIESAECPPNSVAQQLQKGYLLNDRLLRPALVMVAKAPPASEPAEGE